MSIRVMTLVWDRFPGSGSELLVMLALADWCSDEGDSLHPSIARVATKIRASESQARRILHKLIEDGWLSVEGNAFGGAPGTTRKYRMVIPKLMATPVIRATPTPSTDATPSMDATPSTGARDGLHGCAETGSTHDTLSVSRSIKEPSGVKTVVKRIAGDYPGDFEVAWRTYPQRYGTNNKRDAYKAWNARLRAGHTPEVIQRGVDAYHAHIVAAGKVGTEHVMMAATFFGPSCKFLDHWPHQPPPDGQLPAANKSATRSTIERLMAAAHGQGAITHD